MKAKKIKAKELGPFTLVYDKQSSITGKKKELIRRDPLFKDLSKKLKEDDPPKNVELSKEIENLRLQLEEKWNAGFYITGWARPIQMGIIVIEHGKDFLSPVKVEDIDFSGNRTVMEYEPIMITNKRNGYPVRGEHVFTEHPYYIRVAPHVLNIQIDLTLINKAHKSKVQNVIWDMVMHHLPNHDYAKMPTGKDPKELNFLRSIKDDTFLNYLWWYDLHKNEKVSQRLIALYEKEKEKGSPKTSELLERIRTKKIKWGDHIKGEDRIQKGVNKIYQAIFRGGNCIVEPEFDEYNCPEHGSDCPGNCSYLRKWQEKFDRLFPS